MPNWFSGNVLVSTIKLHYHRTGGDKPSLVLTHGLTDNGLCWTRTAKALERKYDLIMVDARGHGRSDAPAAGYTPADRAADLAGFMEALGLGKSYLMGHSMGADTVALTAATYPHLVGGAILEDPPWYEGLSSAQSREDSAREWRTKLLERQSKPFAALVAAGPQEHPDWAETEFGAWAEAKLRVSLNALQVLSELRPHWPETITKITCPSLLLMGDPERGGLVTPEVAAQVTQRCPHFKVTRIRNAGHNIRREQFEQFMTAVTAFLADL